MSKKQQQDKVTGVTYVSRLNKWLARIRVDDKLITLGLFANKADADNARRGANAFYKFDTYNLGDKPGLSQERVKFLFNYNRDTGDFTSNIRSRNCKVGQHMGRVMKESGYLTIGVDGKHYLASRLAWLYVYNDFLEGFEIDHINGVRLDNRIINLRKVDKIGNCRNKAISEFNVSGVTGVRFEDTRNKWLSFIHVNNKMYNLGRFNTIEGAIAARKAAEIKHGFDPLHGKSQQIRAERDLDSLQLIN